MITKKNVTIYTTNTSMPGIMNLPAVDSVSPAIVFTNGYCAYKEMYDSMAEAFCENGYVTLQYDNRGTAGSRRGFELCGTEWKDDINAAVSFIYGCPEVDKSRIGLAGVSMGGAMTLIQGSVDPRIKAVYAMAPYINAEHSYKSRFIKNIGEEGFNAFLQDCFDDAARTAHGFDAAFIPENYSCYEGKERTEINQEEIVAREKHPLKITSLPYASHLNKFLYVDALPACRNIKIPVLLTHGTKDKTLDFEESVWLFDNIASQDKKFVPIEGAGHVLPEVAEQESINYGLEWFDKYL